MTEAEELLFRLWNALRTLHETKKDIGGRLVTSYNDAEAYFIRVLENEKQTTQQPKGRPCPIE